MVSSAFSVYLIHFTGVFFGYLSVKTCKISVFQGGSMNSIRIRMNDDDAAGYHHKPSS